MVSNKFVKSAPAFALYISELLGQWTAPPLRRFPFPLVLCFLHFALIFSPFSAASPPPLRHPAFFGCTASGAFNFSCHTRLLLQIQNACHPPGASLCRKYSENALKRIIIWTFFFYEVFSLIFVVFACVTFFLFKYMRHIDLLFIFVLSYLNYYVFFAI